MTLRDPFDTGDEQPVSWECLQVADFLAERGDEGASYAEIEAATRVGHARDKVRSLDRHGWVIGLDRGECVLVVDPRDRAAA
jgi:hypothetical protein